MTAQSQVTITLVGNTAPVCSNATGGEIWPPDNKRFFAAAIYNVTDRDGRTPSIRITAVLQDEPVEGAGDGNFTPDAWIVGSTAWVRGQRAGAGDGRLYEIQFEATDAYNASCTGSVMWTVPKSQGEQHTTIDSGVRYNSLIAKSGTVDKKQDDNRAANAV